MLGHLAGSQGQTRDIPLERPSGVPGTPTPHGGGHGRWPPPRGGERIGSLLTIVHVRAVNERRRDVMTVSFPADDTGNTQEGAGTRRGLG